MSTRWFAIAALVFASRLLAQTSAKPITPQTTVVEDLLRSLWVYDEDGRPSGSRNIGFQLPESLVNSYLEASLSAKPRPMIASMQVQLRSGNRCIVEAKINFDELRAKEPSLFSGAAKKEFRGLKLVRAELQFSVNSGFLSFQAKPLESQVTPSQDLLTSMIRRIAAQQPEKIDTTHKIPVPFGLRKLWTEDRKLCGET